jgi:hypothetical protein
VKVITCINNKYHPGYKYGLSVSCRYYNYELITILTEEWKSHRDKDRGLQQALNELEDHEIILFTDGYDTLFLDTPQSVLSMYDEIRNGKEIVISAEKCCYPDPQLTRYYPASKSPFSYVNSGGIIGTVAAFKDALNCLKEISEMKANEAYTFSNQYLWTWFFILYPEKITLDDSCRIFQTLSPDMSAVKKWVKLMNSFSSLKGKNLAASEFRKVLRDFEYSDSIGLFNTITKTKPKHLHFNSPISKSNMFEEPFKRWIRTMHEGNNSTTQVL